MNLTKITEQYILDNPSIRDSLKKGVINYSKLSRQIIKDLSLKQSDFDAILIALRRREYQLRKKPSFDKPIKELLKNTQLEIKSKILVVVIARNIFYSNIFELYKAIKQMKGEIHIIEGKDSVTIITNNEFESIITKYFKGNIIKKTLNLIEIILQSPASLEDTPGVVGYLYSLFMEKGINIVETMSCWTDTIFVIDEKYLEKAVKVLNFK